MQHGVRVKVERVALVRTSQVDERPKDSGYVSKLYRASKKPMNESEDERSEGDTGKPLREDEEGNEKTEVDDPPNMAMGYIFTWLVVPAVNNFA